MTKSNFRAANAALYARYRRQTAEVLGGSPENDALATVIVGVVLGPHALNVASDSGTTRQLAELGVAFLLFSLPLAVIANVLQVVFRRTFQLSAFRHKIVRPLGA